MSTETSDKNVANEECIKILEDYLKNSAYKQSNSDFFKNGGWEIVNLEVPQAIEHILSEREQDKKKIKELEEHQKKFYNGELYTAKQLKQIEENQNKYFINKQKVKDVLQKNRNELFSTTYVDDIQYKPYTMQIDRINKIERELLEGE